MRLLKAVLLAAALLVPQAPAAATSHEGAAALTDGEVRRVDRDAMKITIRHGPIPNLDMPAMSMVFQVKDAALLDKAKAGDKVRFSAEKTGSQYVVTRIEPAREPER